MEYQKFGEIVGDSRFPAITSSNINYYGKNQTEVFPKFAVLTYDIGQNQSSQPINSLPFGNSTATDAFGRLRVSLPDTLHNAKQIVDNVPYVYSNGTAGTAEIYYDSNNASSVLAVSANNDIAIRQTKAYMNYQPGKSQLAFITFVCVGSADVTQRVGIFDSDTSNPYSNLEGFYFEINNGSYSVNIANLGGSNSLSAAQASWNIDKLDGTGASEITLDTNKTQILVIDYEWLGVGRVRFGFNIDGIIYYCHEFRNSNNLTLPYLSNPNKPVRYECRSTGGVGSIRHICSSVASEGGSQDNGVPHAIHSGSSGIGNISDSTEFPAVTIRLKEAYKSFNIRLQNFSCMAAANTNSIAKIILNGTILGPAKTFTEKTDSCIEYYFGTSTDVLSGGTELYTTYFNKTSLPANFVSDSLLTLGTTVDGVRDTITLVLVPCGGQEKYFSSLNWLELL